ncbi:MAG TPA: T9SS type A sorting domain-containing protein, partial [Bacteroidia bacterium]
NAYPGLTFIGGGFDNSDGYFHPDFLAYYLNLPQGEPNLPGQTDNVLVYPNPALSASTVQFSIARKQHVRIELYSMNGSKVGSILNEERNAGNYNESFSTDLSPGIYFVRISCEEYERSVKLVIIK